MIQTAIQTGIGYVGSLATETESHFALREMLNESRDNTFLTNFYVKYPVLTVISCLIVVPLFLAAGQWLYLWYTTEKINQLYRRLYDQRSSRQQQAVLLNTLTDRVKRVAAQLSERGEERRKMLIHYAILDFNQQNTTDPEFWKFFNVVKDHLYQEMKIDQEALHIDQLISQWIEEQRADWGESGVARTRSLEYKREKILRSFANSSPQLSLTHSGLTIIPIQVLSKMPHLQHLELDNNKITTIPHLPLPHLKSLSMHRNEIQEFSSDTLQALQELEELDLAFNKIETLDDGWLRHLPNIQILDLRSNAIRRIGTLEGGEKLKILNLYSNNITKCAPSCFSLSKSLEQIRLHSNLLVKFPESLREVTSLRILSLSGNLFKQIENADLEPLKQLKKLWLDDTMSLEQPSPYNDRVRMHNVPKKEHELPDWKDKEPISQS